jgi:hypothetical protein
MKAFLLGIALTALVPAAAMGQTIDHGKMMHDMTMAGELPQETGQSAFAAIQEIVDKLSADPAAMMKLQALGFIGFMTLGMHHQEHHWMLANGKSPHN